ncbi:MAG: hypothetical protein A2785_01000 [Candidatus Chisholmbacteria bacterium RIFCSPHIGHO2_01_FULL_49_18]|uniref:Glycosyltransferase 2-like domain-containing protein n=2 Tax=Candidatus Chisholmiibacteriota TaxID=1817900 RepID=A0A1G1VL64_9BACT|nr:MAG: hypothetical protein A2785_01000 [Candidatus Chisholmbacteria bacterium RIFCSPHIGHO2_01_FULL_49_18]OGY22135.1 MAG: hypothetical protein A3A65_01520 [Candidatus Chisholmbacteria bacterium RIFCSPLOWO2_01_FULL_49_14]
MKIGFPFGINVLIWSVISFIRSMFERRNPHKKSLSSRVFNNRRAKVAVCLPAHNEEAVIKTSITSITRQLPRNQVYVVSDGSTDRTVAIAKSLGCQVLDRHPGAGKANALKVLIEKYALFDRYEFIVFVDADTQLDRHYLKRALALFEARPQAVAVAAYAVPIWRKGLKLNVSNYISAYRTKLYRILQMFIMYGQTWQLINVNPVVPGFASMYRTRALRKLDLATPGIWIEDFNLAFQIHKMRLGQIAHDPTIRAYYHDPLNLKDYIRQVSRWNVGYYQTVRLQGIWPSVFWFSTGLFSLEMLLNATITISLPLIMLWYYLTKTVPNVFFPESSLWQLVLNNLVLLWELVLGLALADYALTIFVAVKDKRPWLLVFGLGFFLFHILNSVVLLAAIPKGLFWNSEGRWEHAER